MDQMMGYCGILCEQECPTYAATINNDVNLRRTTAKKWSKLYNTDFQPEQINCRGCRSEDLFVYCQICEIRACNIEKRLNLCSECDSFPCIKAGAIVDHVPGVKKRLKAYRK